MICVKSSLIFLWFIIPVFTALSQVSISPTLATPDPSAILDIQSTSKGVLVPRLSTAQHGSTAVGYRAMQLCDNRISNTQEPKSYQHHSSSYTEDGLLQIATANSKPDIGFIAQEVYEIIPEAARPPVNAQEDLWAMDYHRLIPVLVRSVQELNDKIIALEQSNNALQRQLLEYRASAK